MAKKLLKLSLICLLCSTFFAAPIFSQNSAFKKADAYATKIARLKKTKKLTKYSYPEKSCGGALDGWFADDALVYLEAFDGDYDQETRYFVYIKNEQILKVITKFYGRGRRGEMILKNIENAYPKSYNPFECGDEMIADIKREKTSANDKK